MFARQGSAAAAWRRRGTRTYGPYYRLNYREDGRQQSVYLGRLNGHLRLLGLRMQGFEVRGWRTSPMRRWLRSLRIPRIGLPRIPGIPGMRVPHIPEFRSPLLAGKYPLDGCDHNI